MTGFDAGNLSTQALRDLAALLTFSAKMFGETKARQTETDILQRCQDIAGGIDLGHLRQDIRSQRRFRFWSVPPHVIVYDPTTRLVIRILHGRRDLPRLIR